VRARLYRSAVTGIDGLPTQSALLDGLGLLPAANGVTTLDLALRIACFDVPADPVAGTSCDPTSGKPAPAPLLSKSTTALPKPGDFVADTSCSGAAPPGMACVPGGAFLLGDARFSYVGAFFSYPERLVRLSAFYMDVDEFSLGAFRTLINDGVVSMQPQLRASSGDQFDECVYLGKDDPTHDALPVNCVPRWLAEEACVALGKRLPTEAEWEYAASNRTLETTYPWGNDDPTCAHLVAGRGASAGEGFENIPNSTFCRIAPDGEIVPEGPIAGGIDADATLVGIKNLGGNMSEWVADDYAPYDSECWRSGPVILDNPKCMLAEQTIGVTRGTSWNSPMILSRAAARGPGKSTAAGPAVGFRCVKPAP